MYDGYLGLFVFQSCSRTVSEIIRFITASSLKYRRINSLLKASLRHQFISRIFLCYFLKNVIVNQYCYC